MKGCCPLLAAWRHQINRLRQFDSGWALKYR
jgi:hypothetical protein